MTKPSTEPRPTRAEREREREKMRILASPRKFRAASAEGELLAIRPEAIDFDWIFMGPKPNVRTDDGVAIVTISGPMEHHHGWLWDSYEDICSRVESAMIGTDVVEAHERQHRWDADYEPIKPVPAKAVIMSWDSPGGEAAGATAAHRHLRALRSQYGIPLYSYANEMMCSAAYELGCAADEIWLPDTAMVGSIGVIATIFDRTEQNAKLGLNIELVTSGEYKADNHADRVIDDGVRGRIRDRVMDMARIFWGVVADARGTSPDAVASLEAGVFLGGKAVEAGIADGVASMPGLLRLIASTIAANEAAASAFAVA
jgi:hypothetical protein